MSKSLDITRGPKETLEQCLEGFNRAAMNMERRAEAAKYDYLTQGLFLLKAKEIHALPTAKRGQGRKSGTPGVPDSLVPASNGGHSASEGFEAWVYAHIQGLTPMRAYERIRVAQNCGLTALSTLEDVHDLMTSRYLEGKPLKALMRPQAALEAPQTTTEPAEATLEMRAVDLTRPIFDDVFTFSARHEDELFHLPLQSADPEAVTLTALEVRLRTLLDKIRAVRKEREDRLPKVRSARGGRR